MAHYCLMVGARRFELPTPCAQGRCATRLRYAPSFDLGHSTQGLREIKVLKLNQPAVAMLLRVFSAPCRDGSRSLWLLGQSLRKSCPMADRKTADRSRTRSSLGGQIRSALRRIRARSSASSQLIWGRTMPERRQTVLSDVLRVRFLIRGAVGHYSFRHYPPRRNNERNKFRERHSKHRLLNRNRQPT